VSGSEHEGLLARVRQIRRAAKSDEPIAASRPDPDALSALEARVAHLEQLLQGLQDSVHRESARESKRISELEAQIQPGAISKALSDDARRRGL
jgi:hypothetical protein